MPLDQALAIRITPFDAARHLIRKAGSSLRSRTAGFFHPLYGRTAGISISLFLTLLQVIFDALLTGSL